MEEIYTRRSIRKYTDKKVPENIIEDILKAWMNAPSARNLKQYEFVVVKDKDNLDYLHNTTPYAGMIKESAFTVIMLSNDNNIFWQFDLWACVQNMLLKAESHWIWSCVVGVWEKDHEEYIEKKFRTPKNLRILCMVSFGYPQDKAKRNDNYYEGKVHKEKY